MRRGLISWSREELPEHVLDARVQRLQSAMRREQLDLVLMYSTFAQPAASHWVCNFTPYWSEALAAVLPDGAPLLLAALTQRVHPWIRSVSHVAEVLNAPRLGEGAVTLIKERVPPLGRIGVVGLDEIPWSVMQPLVLAGLADRLVDASEMFAALRQPADHAEVGLARQATRIAQAAVRAASRSARNAADVTAPIELSARLAGAEEVLLRIAPDLRESTVLARMEGDAPLGTRYAVEVSIAYKGVWVRWCETLSADAPSASDSRAQVWFDQALAQLASDGAPPAWTDAAGGLSNWSLEASLGMHPLTVIGAHDLDRSTAIAPGSLAVFSAELELADGPWLASASLQRALPQTAPLTA